MIYRIAGRLFPAFLFPRKTALGSGANREVGNKKVSALTKWGKSVSKAYKRFTGVNYNI